jgi:MoaA/NifB/PqqE/SkfB family radical SAM enzyme
MFFILRKHQSFNHTVSYIKLSIKNQKIAIPYDIELTNICNLQCSNCPTPTTKYHKGFISDDDFNLALKYAAPREPLRLHRLGEPLLHKNFLQYLIQASDLGLKTIFSTNGLLLTEKISKEIVEKCKPYMVCF